MSVSDPQPLVSIAKPIEPYRHRPTAEHGARSLQLPAPLLLELQSDPVAHRQSLQNGDILSRAQPDKTKLPDKIFAHFLVWTRRHEILIVLKPTTPRLSHFTSCDGNNTCYNIESHLCFLHKKMIEPSHYLLSICYLFAAFSSQLR